MSALKVAILWHLHQPSYWDPRVSKYRYPWVFLHTARHYHSMAAIAREYPEVQVTFNITPVLLEQIDHYVSGNPLNDRLLESFLKPAADVNEEELFLILDHVFQLHLPTMIHPFPRYKELYSLLGVEASRDKKRRVTPKDILDLQVLYLLTWCGSALRGQEPVKELIRKAKDFTENDKQAVFSAMLKAVKETLPLYRDLQESGQAEITTTPYFHPILPLLIDTSVAREARPGIYLDEIDFRFRQDAEWQVRAGIQSYEAHFQRPPLGMWPAEGSVSDDALRILSENGLIWAGADEGVLGRSLGKFGLSPEEKYQPYRFADTPLWVYFRDRELSDRIGFVYSGWEAEKAAGDLLGRLLDIRKQLNHRNGEGCVTIILDGENPWEYYADGGLGFLNGLYRRLSSTTELQMVKFSTHRRSFDRAPSLHHVVPGSWIDANFDTWIGCSEKNHAWKLLMATRREIEAKAPKAVLPYEIYRAEGSDWFWWLGPGHDTPYESSYENLFRLNCRIGLEKLQIQPPAILEIAVPILPTPVFQPPLHLFTPIIDGKYGSYYDWIAAGSYRASEGSFHRTQRYLEKVRFGADLENLYFRVEGDLKPVRELIEKSAIWIEFNRPQKCKFIFSKKPLHRIDKDGISLPSRGRAAIEVFFEIGLPFKEVGAEAGEIIEFAVSVVMEENLLDRLPQSGYILTTRPGPDFGQGNWSV